MEREQAIDQIINARTLEECQAAEKVLASWMQTCTKDWTMLDAGEQLAIIRESWAESESSSARDDRRILREIFEEWRRWPGKEAKFTVLPVMDETDDHYLLLTVGWDGYKRIHGMLAHIRLVGGKFYIEYDSTEEGIATDLLNAGVPKDRIVLAFQHPERREWGEFAVK